MKKLFNTLFAQADWPGVEGSGTIKYMEKHYICTGGCQGVSDKLGVCQAEDCPDYQKPLKECNCEDGLHGEEKVDEE